MQAGASSSSFAIGDIQRTLWIGQLPAGSTEASLLELFAHEQAISVLIARDPRSSASLGYGFITFATRAAAQNFLLKYNGWKFEGAVLPIKLRWSSQDATSQLTALPSGDASEVTDSHSLFVGDLPPEISDLELQQHFQTYFPTATSAKVITDRLSGQSKGYGFVRFSSQEERDRALSVMNGQKIGQQTMRVNRAKAKKYQGDGLFYPSDHDANNTTAFVGNVNTDITEEDLYNVFKRCGDIVSVKLLKAKGCAFITYANRSAAERAINYLHGKVIKNSAVRLCWGRRSIYNSFPLPHPVLTAQNQQSLIPLQSLQTFTPQHGATYSQQGYLPQQHFPASSMLPGQGFPGHNPFGFQGQPYWRPELQAEFQGQRMGGQAGLPQGLLTQPFISQSMPSFSVPQRGQRPYSQGPHPSTYTGIPRLSSDTPAAAPSLEAAYRASSSHASPYMQSIGNPNLPGRRHTIADTEEVFAHLSLGPGPAASSFS